MSKYLGRIITNQAPAGYSVYFDGTGDYLTVASNAALGFGTGDFTVEFWVNLPSASTTQVLFDNRNLGTGIVMFSNSGTLTVNFNNSGGTLITGGALTSNTWTHIALSRASGSSRLYINGTQSGSTASDANNYPTNATYIGSNFSAGQNTTGYISNIRILKGTGLYTAAFTPPTQLLNVTNTSLLTCNSPAIVDQSSNAFAITTNGNAAVSTFTPFVAYNPAPTSSNPLTPAPGVWTLDEALQYTQQGVWPSYAVNAIEDVFSTFLYTGTGAARTITNNIDLSGRGGLVWMKSRSAATDHALYDTVRGATFDIGSNLDTGQTTQATGLTAFNSNGFNIGALAKLNTNNATYVSWTFREQAKFFDVVTYTGTGSARTVSHNLGSVPGCIMVKRTDTTGDWRVYHRGLTSATYSILLNLTNAESSSTSVWNSTAPTATEFSVGTAAVVNANGGTYVAYLFAHNAGGFGPTSTDNVISCGSYTGTGVTNNAITLGYEPQWILIKRADSTANWVLYDSMRGIPMGTGDRYLSPNATTVETDSSAIDLTATGFSIIATSSAWNASGGTYIYIAIRRGPMRPPSSGTSVFGLNARNGTGANATVTGGAGVTDLALIKSRTGAFGTLWVPRLAGTGYLLSSATTAETAAPTTFLQANPWDVMDGVKVGTTSNTTNDSGATYINYLFDRAPGFMDVVCYTGGGALTAVAHNLSVEPELIITKRRDAAYDWVVYSKTLGTSKVLFLNLTDAQTTFTGFANVTSSSFETFTPVNNGTQVAYLFATVGGVSKVGSYTGTGTTQQINCGFTNGARFVMIKRTDSTGAWYVWDSARGIVAGNDPYFLMNSTAVEVTNTDYVDTYSLGFELSSTAPADLNANSGTYIFLAIA